MFCEFQIFSSYGTSPFSPVCATFLAELCNPVTRQAIELENCLNPLRFSKSCFRIETKQFFVLGLSFSGGHVTSRGVFVLIWPSSSGLGAVPMGHFWMQTLVEI